MDNMAEDVISDEEPIEIYLRQRVRIFVLSKDGREWSEIGIGRISTNIKDNLNETFLMVHAEDDDFLLLNSRIRVETVYQKLQERFIIWTEEDTVVGLSFQVNAGCDDIWEMICQAQGKNEAAGFGVDAAQEFQAEETIITSIGIVETEAWFEQMLDIEFQRFSTYEREVLEPLIEQVNRLMGPAIVAPMPLQSSLVIDRFQVNEGVRETEAFQQLHGNILNLLSTRRDTPN